MIQLQFSTMKHRVTIVNDDVAYNMSERIKYGYRDSTVGWIKEAGWETYWTPLPARSNWLHVRLVANSTIEQGINPTIEEAQAISEAFVKAF